ncbi:MAG TPA: glycosyltransferase family 4 protein [Trebonia sp.]|nr:glycosyltransferase family 4 protein [Trebonia sp.]
MSVERVALVTGEAAGGMGAHVGMLASGLAEAGVAVTVLGPPGAPVAGASFLPVAIGPRPRPADARTVARLRRLLAGHADVVHAHGLRAGALCALALAGRRGRPALVVTVHNAPPGGRAAALVYRALEAVVARRAGLVLAVSADLAARLRRAGARRVDQAVIAAPAAPPAAGPDRAAPGRERPVVLAAGRLAAQKGLDVLLDAAAAWDDLDPRPRVVIAGEGPLGDELRARAARLGVDAAFLGHRDDVPALLAACDVFVLPSRWEGQPLVLQEALRAGAAIVASRAGGIPALAGPEAARLVAPGDVAGLASGVRAVLRDHALTTRLRAAARRRAATLPTAADAIAAALAAYAEAAGRARRGGR